MSDWDVVGERAAPKAGAGEWDVVGEAPFQPVQQKRQVGIAEAFGRRMMDSMAAIPDFANAAAAQVARPVDALLGTSIGKSLTNPNGPVGQARKYWQIDPATEELAGRGAAVAQGLGSLPRDIGASIVTGGLAPAAEALSTIPELPTIASAIRSLVPEIAHGAKAMMVPAAIESRDTVNSAVQQGATPSQAVALGTVRGLGTVAQGALPMSVASPSRLVRGATGAAINVPSNMVQTATENAVSPESMQRPVLDVADNATAATIGAIMAAALGPHANGRPQTPESVVADRTNWNNSHDADTVIANHTIAPEAMPLADVIAAATGAKNRPESVAEWQQQQQAGRGATAQRANELRSTFKGVDLPNDPFVPNSQEQAIRHAYDLIPQAEADRAGNAPPSPRDTIESARNAFDRAAVADQMELPPTVREGVQKENSNAYAKQAFDIAARRQQQADADLANRDQLAPDYQGGGSAAHGGEFDAGIRRVTLLDGEVPIEVIAHDGKTATVSLEQNGKAIEFDVPASRVTEHDIPANPRMAQDFRARSDEPPAAVGVGTMAGEKMPRRSTDRIAGDEIGGLTTPYDPSPRDGGMVEGTVLPSEAGTGVVHRSGGEGQTVNGESSHPIAGVDMPNGQKQIGNRRTIEDRNRFAVDERGRTVDRENRVSGIEGQPLRSAQERSQNVQEAPPRREQPQVDTTTAQRQESAPTAQERAAPLTPEQRAKDPETLAELKRMADNAGWAEVGGKLLRDENDQPVGRTQWVPNEPWFKGGMGKKNINDAIARIDAGKPLTKKHQSVIETMLDYIDENDVLGRKAQAEETLSSESLEPTPQNMSDFDLAEKALMLYPDQFEAIAVKHASNSQEQFMQEIRSLLDGEGNQHAAETHADKGNSRPADSSSTEGSGPTNRTHEANDGAGQNADAAGAEQQRFSLDSYSADELHAAAEKKAAAERQSDSKAKADAERNDFTLTGSERKADANPNQRDILDSPNKLYDIGSYVGENVVKAMKESLGWAEQKIGRVLHEVTDPVFSTADGTPSVGLLDYLNRKFADNFAFVENVQKSVGHEVEEAADTVLAQRLLAGKTGDRLRRFDDGLMNPLKQAITTASKNKGVTLDDINDFLYARHAPERNRQVASINPGKLDGSGITNQQARDTLAKFDKDGKTAALNRIAAEFDKITALERTTLADAGLIDKETLANWQRAYKHYAPLKGEESDTAFSHNGGNGGFGSQAKYGRATGRFSQASNLIERAIMNAQIAVIRSEKTEVGRAFLKFAQDNPNKSLVSSIDKLPTKAEIRSDGSVGYATDGLAAMSDRVMTVVDRSGQAHQIVFAKNEAGTLLARALNGMGAKESGVVVRVMSKISRLYAGLQTKWNPEFVVTNALRDVQTAIGTVGADFGHKMTGKVLADYRKAATAIVANESGGKVDFSSDEWKDWHDRFRAAGGETHFVSVDDVSASGKILQQAVESGYSALQPKGAWRKGAEAASRALGVIDVANSAIENALRLSVFKNLVEAGHSEAKAAMAAKECTVNFNRHGEAGPAINAAYVFFNAAVQGQMRLVRLFKEHPAAGAKLAGTLAGLGGSLATMNYMLSGDDEDGRSFYDKVPTEVKNRWAVLMVPDGMADTLREYAPGWMLPSKEDTAGQLYLKLFPLAPGLGMFANAGGGMVEASQADSASLAREILTKRMLSTVIDSFNPFGSNSVVSQIADGEYSKAAGEFGKLASPTAFDPFVELGLNSNFMGSKIYKEQQEHSTTPPRPNSEVSFKKTSDTSKAIARWINSATGGDDLRGKNIDMSADMLDYLAGYVTGGAGRFVMNLGKTIGDAAEGKEPDYKRVPFTRLVAGDANGSPYDQFNKAQHEVQLSAEERKLGRDTNDDVAALAGEEKAAAAFIEQQRKLLSKIQGNVDLSDDEIQERETAINRRIESRMKQFLGRYYEAGGKKLSY